MKREVVQDFLNLPGIEGVALMDGRSHPYFLGLDQTLNFQQKQVLAQGIQQVIETTPPGFESFEFQFTGRHIYIYKLNQGTVLLVLTNDNLQVAEYLQAVGRLKAALQTDITKAVATFRLLAGSISLSGQNYWESTATSRKLNPTEPSNPRPATFGTTVNPPNGAYVSSVTPATGHQAADHDLPCVGELLTALNQLSQFTTHYLGKAVVTNYWKSSRPEVEWLNQFQIERAATITLDSSTMSPQQLLIEAQHQWVKTWVAAFIDRCTHVIRDFPALVAQKALDPRQQQILLSKPDFPSVDSLT